VSFRERILVQKFDGHYCSVSLSREGQYKISWCIASCWRLSLGHVRKGWKGGISRIGIPKTTRSSNLSWGTPSQNQADRLSTAPMTSESRNVAGCS